ncbi:hypothetical protein EPN90_04505 [Patescibacteria group bacterium]|nr:MAG: hypothetical protein EPN90_04505 [Patescibacteria group bacterium]
MKKTVAVMAAFLLLLGAGCALASKESPAAKYGVAYSPRGYPDSVTDADVRAFFADARGLGGLVAFHTNWRDNQSAAGEIPQVTQFARAAAKEFGIVPAVGFGWTVGDQADLVSVAAPKNNSWLNEETRQKFREMVVSYAKENQPRFLFLGNEIDGYYLRASKKEWQAWVSEFRETYDAVKAASPKTIVFTTLQLERLKGNGKKNGWRNAPAWELVKDFGDKIDALGFTTYPYFDYDAPAAIPDDYYSEIKKYWSGPVIFTELGWLAKNSGPYRGSEAEQTAFVKKFFGLTKELEVKYAAWLFAHDLSKAPPAFDGIGLKAADGAPRPAYAAWREMVAGKR